MVSILNLDSANLLSIANKEVTKWARMLAIYFSVAVQIIILVLAGHCPFYLVPRRSVELRIGFQRMVSEQMNVVTNQTGS